MSKKFEDVKLVRDRCNIALEFMAIASDSVIISSRFDEAFVSLHPDSKFDVSISEVIISGIRSGDLTTGDLQVVWDVIRYIRPDGGVETILAVNGSSDIIARAAGGPISNGWNMVKFKRLVDAMRDRNLF